MWDAMVQRVHAMSWALMQLVTPFPLSANNLHVVRQRLSTHLQHATHRLSCLINCYVSLIVAPLSYIGGGTQEFLGMVSTGQRQ